MSDFKGTPGPWFIKPVSRLTVEGTANVIQTNNNNGHGYHIAYASGWIDDESTKAEADANALILAAAPDLLEALQELFADYQQLADSVDSGFWSLEDTEVGKKSLAAIAKALGK